MGFMILRLLYKSILKWTKKKRKGKEKATIVDVFGVEN